MFYGIAAAITALVLAAVLTALLLPEGLGAPSRSAPATPRKGHGGYNAPRRRGRRRGRRLTKAAAGRGTGPVPLLGGVGVALATGTVAVVGDRTGIAPLGSVGVLLVSSGAVAALGLIAEVWRLKTRFLLAGTALAAACVVPYGEIGLPAGLSAIAWIVFVTVAFKGLDRADGLAGTVGVVTAFGVGLCAAAEMMDGLVVLLSVLAAALTGFLMHHGHPMRTRLGACGSLFTGLVLASAAVLTQCGRGSTASGAGVLFALTAVASADAVLVLLSRRLAGRPLLRSGSDHLAHRLRRLGLTPQGANVVLGAGAFVGVFVGVLVHTGWVVPTAALWLAAVVLAVVLGLLRIPVYRVRRQPDVSVRPPRPPRRGASSQVSGRLRIRNG